MFMDSSSQNPISPPGYFIADPTARVWSDGKLYIYGSADESCNHYCSRQYHVLVTEDTKNWTVHENAFRSAGEGDKVKESDALLFAPDCIQYRDSFFLYFCMPDTSYSEGVAASANPEGPFSNSQRIDLGGYNEIDPTVFIDDDGQAYYAWGQFTLKMAKMNPDMRSIDLSTLKDSVLNEPDHFFHEGAFMTKRNGIYYLVYADISRADMPTCIGYATSHSPMGPYTYGGVIIDNDHCNPGNWNNHGSIAEFKDQWYVFYHRSTHACEKMRKACMEPIVFNPDGSIDEVEMTSQGAAGALGAGMKIEAEWACLLHGNIRMIMDEGKEILTGMGHNDKIAYKYIDFGDGIDSVGIRLKRGKDGGKISIRSDKPWHSEIASIHIEGSPEGTEWETLVFKTNKITGTHAVWFQFTGKEADMFELDWFSFSNSEPR